MKGKREVGNGNLGPGSTLESSLSWTTAFKPSNFSSAAIQSRSPNVPSKEPGGHVATAPSLIFKDKGPSPSLKSFPNWNELLAAPWHCCTQLRLGRDVSSACRRLAQQNRRHADSRQPARLSPGPSSVTSGAEMLATEPRPWPCTASQATSVPGKDLWSHFLSTSASFCSSLKISYFPQNQFLFSPSVAVAAPQTER